MATTLCYSCSSPLPDRAIFCPVCAKQVRCKNCHELLEPNARACIMCGTLIGEGGKEQETNKTNTQNIAANRIEYKETLKMRSFNANFTDQVGSELTETLNLLLSHRVGVRKDGQRVLYKEVENQRQLLTEGNSDIENSEEPKDVIDNNQFDREKTVTEDNGDTDRLKKIFRFEDNKITLLEPRIKATTKLDFARRLSYLFLYANEWDKRPSVPRGELNAILEQNNVLDAHTRTWISTSPDLEVNKNIVKLRNPGREKAINILEEAFDQKITKSWLPGTPSKKRIGKRVTPSTDDKQDNVQNAQETPKQETPKDETKQSATKKSSKRTSSGRPGGMQILDTLISNGYFSERRTLGEIISYCSSSLALSYKNTDLSPALIRCVQKSKLKRETNSDGQYAYFV